LACSITAVVAICTCSRANAESCKMSRRGRPRRTWSRAVRAWSLLCSDRRTQRFGLPQHRLEVPAGPKALYAVFLAPTVAFWFLIR